MIAPTVQKTHRKRLAEWNLPEWMKFITIPLEYVAVLSLFFIEVPNSIKRLVRSTN
jgi:hypothetical protein